MRHTHTATVRVPSSAFGMPGDTESFSVEHTHYTTHAHSWASHAAANAPVGATEPAVDTKLVSQLASHRCPICWRNHAADPRNDGP